MKKLRECTICKSKKIAPKYMHAKDYHTYIPGEYEIWECQKCGIYFLNPMMNQEELRKCYKQDYYSYYDYTKERENINILKKLWRILIKVNTYTPELPPHAKILDIGCGSGEWLYGMKKKGYKVKGCEISKEAAEIGRETAGIDIYSGQLTDGVFKDEEFDFIRSNHSFEHINNPNETLDEIYRILKKGGQLFIGVPNTGGLWSSIYKEYWYYLGAPIHVYNYSDRNLSFLLKRHGFKIKKIRYNGNYFGLAGSMEIRSREKKKIDQFITKFKLLYPICSPVAKLVNLLHMGDCIEIIAEK